MLLIIAVALLALPAAAQISFPTDEFIHKYLHSGPANTVFYWSADTIGLKSEVMKNGSNVTWNLGGRIYDRDTTESSNGKLLTNPKTAPLADLEWFKDATHVLFYERTDPAQADSYSFIKIDDSGIYTLGSVSVVNNTPRLTLAYSEPLMEYKFPIEMGTSWTSTAHVINESGVVTSTSHTRSGEFDGYGTLLAPEVSASALRLHMNWKTTYFIGSTEFNIETNSFKWMTKSGLNADISSDSALNPSSAFYWTINSSNVHGNSNDENTLRMQLSNNPICSTTTLSFNMPKTETAVAYLTDASGREVKTLFSGTATSGENSISLNPGTLPNGTYFVHLVTHGITSTQKLIITK